MKHRASILLIAAATMLSAPAYAATAFMLQFGSFETREEAQLRLSELQAKHTGVLGVLTSGIREVTLPPDNLTVYRTQAGPLDTRANAQSICSQLASNGDECYVVETALSTALAPVAKTPAAAVATAITPVAPSVVPAVAAPVSKAAAVATAAAAPAITAAATPAVTAITTAPDAVPAIAMAKIPARDPGNVAAINRISPSKNMPTVAAGASAEPLVAASPVATTPPAAAAPTPAPAASDAMKKAMDKAVAEQKTGVSHLDNVPTPPGAKPEGSFWSRVNPFADDSDTPTPAAKPPVVATAPLKAPMVDVDTHPASAIPAREQPMIAQKPLPIPAPLPVPQPKSTAAVGAVATSPLPSGMDTTRVITQAPPLPLPPPPAPLVGKGSIDSSTAASLRTTPPVVAPQSLGNLNTPPPIVIADAPAGTGSVRVGEAQRVPLSAQTLPPPPAPSAANAAPAVLAPGSSAVSLRPSATLGQKTLWAQIGQFADAQTALAFWDQYRRSHPDFPVVRVRVTSPLQAVNRGLNQVSLRVGPFAKESSIRTLCATVPPQGLQCGTIADLGTASPIGGARGGYLPGSRYAR